MAHYRIRKNGEISINLSNASKKIEQYARLRGFPKYIAKYELEIGPNQGLIPMVADIDGDRKTISVTQQLKYIQNTLNNPSRGNDLIMIGVDDTEVRAFTLAAAVFYGAINQKLYINKTLDPPFWYSVYGGRWDKLRDDVNYRQSLGAMGVLILGNLAVNSTPEKLEKVRDLLNLYSNSPRILVVAGGNPLDYARESLHIRPNRCIYLGNRKALKVRQV